jgi:hypothetical protein
MNTPHDTICSTSPVTAGELANRSAFRDHLRARNVAIMLNVSLRPSKQGELA